MFRVKRRTIDLITSSGRCSRFPPVGREAATPLRCALLTPIQSDRPALFALSCPGVEFVTLDRGVLGLPEAPNPWGLPEVESADVGLVTTPWYRWLATRHADRVATTWDRIEAACGALAGFDTIDQFALGFP